MKNSLYFITIVILFLNFTRIKTDIPVHCIASQIYGKWIFQISKDKFDPSLNNDKTTCGHGFPNNIVYEKLNNNIDNHELLYLNLNDKMKIEDKDSKEVGYYTLVYDEGMILYFNDSTITVHFYYYPKESGKESTDINDFYSDCNKTHKGWFIKDIKQLDKNWSCVYGYKENFSNEDHVRVNKDYNYKNLVNEKKVTNSSFLKTTSFTQLSSKTETDKSMLNKMYESMTELVENINNDPNSTWKAAINPAFKGTTLLQLHEKLNKNKKLVGSNQNLASSKINELMNQVSFMKEKNSSTNFLQTSMNSKKLRNKKTIIKDNITEPDSKDVTDYKEVSKYLNTGINDIDVAKISKNWDWRNVGGKNYVPKVKNQGGCGSCYAISTFSGLTSRLRIKTNLKDMTELSVQHGLNCGIYTEGCEGGYPILLGKFFNEFDIVPEECLKYNGKTDKCTNDCKNSKRYRVGKYGYLGGFYGNSSEELMMKEIRAHGPILGNIIVPSVFSYYSKGIFSQNALKNNSNQTPSKNTMFTLGHEFQKVEHSTLIVGYGEEDGIKYWIGMNSWGEDWGEKGFYKILRGNNELNIESMVDFIDIEVSDKY